MPRYAKSHNPHASNNCALLGSSAAVTCLPPPFWPFFCSSQDDSAPVPHGASRARRARRDATSESRGGS